MLSAAGIRTAQADVTRLVIDASQAEDEALEREAAAHASLYSQLYTFLYVARKALKEAADILEEAERGEERAPH